jgi:putative molybdopterin biosynthesis protein
LKEKIYIDNTPLGDALKMWSDALTKAGMDRPLQDERINVDVSLGRITAKAVIARLSSPFYHSSAMDGFAVRFVDTFGASEKTPKQLGIPEQAVYTATGNPLPEGFNSVIMVEDINIIKRQKTEKRLQKAVNKKNENEEKEYIEIIKPATPWQHVRTVGEDIVTTEFILPENHRIRSIDIGAMLAGGLTEVRVRRKPKVVVIPTGSELVEPGEPLVKGNIIESNSRILASLVSEWGGEPLRWSIVPDNMEDLKKAVQEASKTGDLIVINAGASAGKKDFTSSVIQELGEVILHGVSIKPGKPVILGMINNRPVLGIPGYPVSAFITFEIFAKPLIHTWQGIEMEKPETLSATLSRHVPSTLGIEEFIRVKVGVVGDKVIASPVSRGAGMLMSLVRADGFMRVPAMIEGLGAGSAVEVRLFKKSQGKISRTIVCIGSHDNIIDILANFLKKRHPALSLSSAHVGSMGGLIALKRGEAHLAGTHLLDEKTGEYNISYVQRLLPDEKIILVNLVYRQQGLFVLKGNPKNIQGFEDLTREDVVFINRQPGSGTRLLTDKYLRELQIDAKIIKGYDREEYSHMTVASAVLSGIADTGLGIRAAAEALGLDFIPLALERYDLAVPEKFYKIGMIQDLFEIIQSDMEFRREIKVLGGYDIRDMGRVVYPPS